MEETGAITGYIDVAQLVLYAFWIFFAGLVVYLLKENKREGYPMDSADRAGTVVVVGWPSPPSPKTYKMAHGPDITVPRVEAEPPINAEPIFPWPGAPYDPQGNPILSRLGPAAYPERAHEPDLTIAGIPKIVPMRIATGFKLAEIDPDPRGMSVIGADRKIGGVISDLWVDRSDPLVRYFEITLPASAASRRILVPVNFAHIKRADNVVVVKAVNGGQMELAPALANVDQVTLNEEDAFGSFWAGGLLFADEDRAEPIV